MQLLPLPSSVFPKIASVTMLLVGWLAWGSFRDPETFWAPGDLSRYHTDIGRCTACHQPFIGPSIDKCSGCHRNIALPDALKHRRKACLECHMEHRGRMAQITMGRVPNPHTK